MPLKRRSRFAAVLMLSAALGFLVYALTHPNAAFPWSHTVTYSVYAVYLLVMILLFAAPFGGKSGKQ